MYTNSMSGPTPNSYEEEAQLQEHNLLLTGMSTSDMSESTPKPLEEEERRQLHEHNLLLIGISTSTMAEPTPNPYEEGAQLQLQVCRSHCTGLEDADMLVVTVNKLMTMTMSPALDVTVQFPDGDSARAVLKIYDRRFGTTLRGSDPGLKCHSRKKEKAFQEFLKLGRMPSLVAEIKGLGTMAPLPAEPGDYFASQKRQRRAKHEATMWHHADSHFRCETKAYAQLDELQGHSIPSMLAHVRLVQPGPELPPDLQPLSSYFDINGILLDHIDGYTLADITSSPVSPKDPKVWQRVIQSATNRAHEINNRGVIMLDCSPRNVMVDKQTHTPYVIDLAQCWFKAELFDDFYRKGLHLDLAWQLEMAYWRMVDDLGRNPAVMAKFMQQQVNWGLGERAVRINGPNYQQIIRDLDSQLVGGSEGGREGDREERRGRRRNRGGDSQGEHRQEEDEEEAESLARFSRLFL